MSNVELIRVEYLPKHGPRPISRASVAEAAHVHTTSVTVGRGTSRGTPVDTGEARGGWRIGTEASRETARKAAFHAIIGAVEVDRFIDRWKLGQPVVWSNIVFHTGLFKDEPVILVGGRRPDKNGRMIGSIQSPDGWIEQSENELRAHMNRFSPSQSQIRRYRRRAA